MERRNKKNKTGREERPGPGDHDHMEKIEFMVTESKKLNYHHESNCMDGLGSCYNTKNGNSHEEQKVELGVFDFPWLKEEGEGVIFRGDDLCQPGMALLEEYTFAFYPSSSSSAALHRDHVHFTSTSLQIDNLCPSALPVLFHHDDDHNKIFEDNPPRLSSFKVDSDNKDQQMECIWSSVLDQPLDVNLNII